MLLNAVHREPIPVPIFFISFYAGTSQLPAPQVLACGPKRCARSNSNCNPEKSSRPFLPDKAIVTWGGIAHRWNDDDTKKKEEVHNSHYGNRYPNIEFFTLSVPVHKSDDGNEHYGESSNTLDQ